GVAEVAIGIDRGERLVVAAEHPVRVRRARGELRIELAGLLVCGNRGLEQSAEAERRDEAAEDARLVRAGGDAVEEAQHGVARAAGRDLDVRERVVSHWQIG